MQQEFDVLVLGAGLAGQTAALALADTKKVLLVSKADILSSASSRAQGGISAVFREPDTHEKHFDDTVLAGGGLNDEEATRFIVGNAKMALDWLIAQGVPFTKEGDDYHLTREGGHSERRILHVDDLTGRAIQLTLTEHIRRHPNIEVWEHHTAVQLLTQAGEPRRCTGALILDNGDDKVKQVHAPAVVLATGGAGQVFISATAPGASTGDGIALAWNIGCRVANLEFLQFHPTCMYYPQGESFLITEAVRGEGGILRLPSGHRFMPEYDERAELAPRDVVARAIYCEMMKNNIPAVMLDISHQPADFIKQHFPNIHRKCLERGIDITREPIPVTPASHYTCGGVVTDLHGRTDVEGLYGVGEVACTGLHGANRLASNSLLECVVMGRSAAAHILANERPPLRLTPTHIPVGHALTPVQANAIELAKIELRRVMWDYVGIVRSQASLLAARRRIEQLRAETELLYASARPALKLAELRNLLTTASLVLDCALSRTESRGCHYNEDHPVTAPNAVSSVLTPRVPPAPAEASPHQLAVTADES